MYSLDALRLLIRSLWSILVVSAILVSTSTCVFSQIVFQPTTGGGSSGLTIGTTTISGGGTNAILYGDGALLQNETAITRSAASQFTFSKAAIGTTPFDSIILTNPTPAAAGIQQESPAIHWIGQGWKTTATAASQQVECRQYILPIQAVSIAMGVLNTDCQSNTGGYSTVFQINSAGGVNVSFGNGYGFSGSANTGYYQLSSGGPPTILASGASIASFGTTGINVGSLVYGFGTVGSAPTTSVFAVSTGSVGIGKGSTIANGLLNLAGATFLDPQAITGATRVLVSLGAADSATTATLTNAGTTKSGGYQSSDGTAGVTQTCTILSITTFVVKNGLIVSCS